MDQTKTPDTKNAAHVEDGQQKAGWLAGGSLLAALGVTSCCVLPLALVLAGVSGAWIGALGALEPYKPIFAIVAIAFIGLGFWRVYGSWDGCAEEQCERPVSSLVTRVALWISALLVVLALTAGAWAPLFY